MIKTLKFYKFKISAWTEISGSKRGRVQVKEDTVALPYAVLAHCKIVC